MPRRQRSPFDKSLAQFKDRRLLSCISNILNSHWWNPIINFPFSSFLKWMSEFRRSIHCLLPKSSDFRILSPIIFWILNIQSSLPNFIITTLPFKSFHKILNIRSVFSHTHTHNHADHNTHLILVFGLQTKWQTLPETQPTITRSRIEPGDAVQPTNIGIASWARSYGHHKP